MSKIVLLFAASTRSFAEERHSFLLLLEKTSHLLSLSDVKRHRVGRRLRWPHRWWRLPASNRDVTSPFIKIITRQNLVSLIRTCQESLSWTKAQWWSWLWWRHRSIERCRRTATLVCLHPVDVAADDPEMTCFSRCPTRTDIRASYTRLHVIPWLCLRWETITRISFFVMCANL